MLVGSVDTGSVAGPPDHTDTVDESEVKSMNDEAGRVRLSRRLSQSRARRQQRLRNNARHHEQRQAARK